MANGMAMEVKGAIAGALKRGGTFTPLKTGEPVPSNIRQPMVHKEKLEI